MTSKETPKGFDLRTIQSDPTTGQRIWKDETETEAPIPVEEAVGSIETEGLPRLSIWRSLLIDVPRRTKFATGAGLVIGVGNEINGAPPIISAIAGLVVFALVYIWTEPQEKTDT